MLIKQLFALILININASNHINYQANTFGLNSVGNNDLSKNFQHKQHLEELCKIICIQETQYLQKNNSVEVTCILRIYQHSSFVPWSN